FGSIRQLYTVAAGEVSYRVVKVEPLHFHHEGENIALLAAAETLVKRLVLVDVERRRFLGMERAEPLVLLACALEHHVLGDHLKQSGPALDLTNNFGSNALH